MSNYNNATFMERVVAWPGPTGPGYVNLHWKRPNQPGMPGRPFKEVPAFMQFAQHAASDGSYGDIYFCLSTQAKLGKSFTNTQTAARGGMPRLLLK
jgi:hypothetical protein